MKELQEESSEVKKEPITGRIIYTKYKYIYISLYISLYIYIYIYISYFDYCNFWVFGRELPAFLGIYIYISLLYI